MFGIGPLEFAVVLIVALLVMGPKKLPELARTVGRGLAEFRRASNDLRRSIDLDLEPHKIDPPPAPAQASSPYQAPEKPEKSEKEDSPEADEPNRDGDHADMSSEPDQSEAPPAKRNTDPAVD